MKKKFEIHLDALIFIVIIIIVSFGFNIYQKVQYSSLIKDFVEAEWKAQNMETNWNYVKGLLENCRETSASSHNLMEQKTRNE